MRGWETRHREISILSPELLPVPGIAPELPGIAKSIRLTGDPQEIDCKYEGIKGLVLRAEFVRKR